MSHVTIFQLLEQRLNANAGGLAIVFENIKYKPQTPTPWMRLNFLPAQTDNPTMGDGFKRENGLMQVSLFYPVGEGATNARAQADALCMAFKRGTSMNSGTLRVLVDKAPFIGPSFTLDGAWFVLPVSVPYIGDVFS
jgi:hypothetical protein